VSSYDVDYDELYRGSAAGGGPPWDIGGPQPALARVLDEVPAGATVLDIGCGQGDLAIALAGRGHDVTAVDISPVGIGLARARAARAGVTVRFEVQDATALSLPTAPFGAVFDSGLLHSLDRRDDGSADTYLASLPGLAAPGAPVFVLAISAAAGEGWRLTADALRASFTGPFWAGTRTEDIDVAAEVDGEPLSLPGFLLRTRRTA
jgi:SAM-dependent methyltransferase